ncbi:MAG: hypothetical protein ACRC7R_01685 [Sarcina sp.]
MKKEKVCELHGKTNSKTSFKPIITLKFKPSKFFKKHDLAETIKWINK